MSEYNIEIDAIGLKCPMPILKCKKGLNSLKIDFKAFCRNTGHDLISYEIENEVTIFYIKKN